MGVVCWWIIRLVAFTVYAYLIAYIAKHEMSVASWIWSMSAGVVLYLMGYIQGQFDCYSTHFRED